MHGTAPTLCLDEGDKIDLGDRSLDVLHVAGVTPGSMVLWEAQTGSLFTSDTLYDTLLELPIEPAEDPAAYVAGLKRIRELPVRTVYPGHNRPFDRDRMISLIDGYLQV